MEVIIGDGSDEELLKRVGLSDVEAILGAFLAGVGFSILFRGGTVLEQKLFGIELDNCDGRCWFGTRIDRYNNGIGNHITCDNNMYNLSDYIQEDARRPKAS